MNPAFMQAAITTAQKGIQKNQSPFGACIVYKGKIIASCHSEVLSKKNSTRHAEIQAIEKACQKLEKVHLNDCEIYSTTEPCPMCFSAIHWARIKTVYYGAEIKDAQQAGFNELTISNRKMKTLGKSKVKIVPNVLKKECRALFAEWKQNPNHQEY